jgi:alpha,alpha-trehalose phosphorylase
MLHRGRRLHVEVRGMQATYTLQQGDPIDLAHHGETFTLTADEPVVREVPEPPDLTPPEQPFGRAPARRNRG